MFTNNPFPKVSLFLPSLPLALIKRLRQVVEAGSPPDTFACYCNLVEWTATYLASLCNSVYKDCPTEQIDERLEIVLRGLSQPLSFGTVVTGLQALGRGNFGLTDKLRGLAAVLGQERLPLSCNRQIRVFQIIKRAREEFSVPPSHLERYVRTQLPDDAQLGRGTLDQFLRNLIEFRNKGVGHQDEEGWFPRDHRMYALLNSHLGPAVDDLLDWEPMRELLTQYEVVKIESSDTWTVGAHRACPIARRHVADGFAPLGPSHLLFTAHLRAEASDYIAIRTPVPHELHAVVRFAPFPQTHQTSEQLYRRYASQYLMTYLERGLITRPQRESELEPAARRLGISDSERSRIEGEIQQAINAYTPEDPEHRELPLQRLAALVGAEGTPLQPRVALLLSQLPKSRKQHLFDQIDNNTIMSFDQLRRESELSEPDLESVLSELEQEGRVRRVGASPIDRPHSHFKAQDPTKPGTFRDLLVQIRDQAPRRRHPAFVRKLVDLCAALLADDGLVVPEVELAAVRALFEVNAGDATPSETSLLGAIVLTLDGVELRADSVRDLYEQVAAHLERRAIDVAPSVPYLIGRTRYLVNTSPVHANGTQFAAPVAIGALYYEANRNRDQALAEVIRWLRSLGLDASSPDLIETERVGEDSGYDEDALSLYGGDGPRLHLEVRGHEEAAPALIQGATVRRFFTALLEFLLASGANIDALLPVRAGRIRYLLAEEPYHANGRRFEAWIERGGYFMNTAFTYDQALAHARALCEQLGLDVQALDDATIEAQDAAAPLRIAIGDEVVEGEEVPDFLKAAVETLHAKGLFTSADIPYKSGRVRHLISESPTHDHGRAFIRPVEVELGDRQYFIEANVSRSGAVELIQRILAGKQPALQADEALR